jgi:hypothetical protein
MSKAELKKVFRRYLDVWEFGDIGTLAGVVHEDYRGHPASGDRDIEGLKARIRAFHETYRNPNFRIEDQLSEEDRVATRMVARAMRTSDGKLVTLVGQNFARVADGLIFEEWMVWEQVPE